MPYIDPLDPLTPAGNTGAALGDNSIREFKRAIIERAETFFNTGVDPWTWKAGVIPGSALANQAVAAAQIANGTITATQLADAAVTVAKLAASAVETAKIADNAVVVAKIADNAVEGPKIKDGTITKAKLGWAPLRVVGVFERTLPNQTISANTNYSETQALAGAALGDFIIGTPKLADDGNYGLCVQNHRVSAADTVQVRFLARAGDAVVTAAAWRFMVLREV